MYRIAPIEGGSDHDADGWNRTLDAHGHRRESSNRGETVLSNEPQKERPIGIRRDEVSGATRPAVEFREGLGAMRLWKGLLVTALMLLMAGSPVAASDDPATVLQRFTAARNSGDVAGAIALLADTVREQGGGVCCTAH